jgi:uncharacterized tellurite resistance protein B-like protein
MLSALFKQLRPAPPQDPETRRRQATAVLLQELVRADFEHHDLETGQLRAELAQAFGISPQQVDELLGSAAHLAAAKVSLHDEIAQLNTQLDAAGKRELIAMLWRLAWADGRVDPQEEALIRRLADLLFVPHGVFVQEKLKAAS